eukprot:s104_g8.t1
MPPVAALKFEVPNTMANILCELAKNFPRTWPMAESPFKTELTDEIGSLEIFHGPGEAVKLIRCLDQSQIVNSLMKASCRQEASSCMGGLLLGTFHWS